MRPPNIRVASSTEISVAILLLSFDGFFGEIGYALGAGDGKDDAEEQQVSGDGEPFGAHELGIKRNVGIDHEYGLGEDVSHEDVAQHTEQIGVAVDVEIGRGLAVSGGENGERVDVETARTGLRREVGVYGVGIVGMQDERNLDDNKAQHREGSRPEVVLVTAGRCLGTRGLDDGLSGLPTLALVAMLLLACHLS